MHLFVNAVGTLVEHHAEHFAGANGSFIHFANLLGINACGLFTHDMKPVFECEDRKTRMLVVGRCDDNGVAQTGFDQLFAVFKKNDVIGQRLLCPVASGRPQVCSGGQFDFGRQSGEDVVAVATAHISKSDDAKFYLIHKYLLLIQKFR